MPKYKLTYFNSRGKAETSRLVLAQAGMEYEDKRVTWDEWQALKPSTPLGFLPVLEVDGKMFGESLSIARYLAEASGLAGSNALENADIFSLCGCVDDFVELVLAIEFDGSEARKAELRKSVPEVHVPRYLGALEKRAMGNNSMRGWIYGPNVTYADLAVFVAVEFVEEAFPGTIDEFPALAKLCASVRELPNIAKWLQVRPTTPF